MQLSQLLIIASLFFDASLACGGFNVCGCFDEHNHMMCTEDLPSPLEETDCNDWCGSKVCLGDGGRSGPCRVPIGKCIKPYGKPGNCYDKYKNDPIKSLIFGCDPDGYC
ncbi:unnamed protein product [Zymoseptoria tritici ST99CH_1A5]|uniref:Uncharacterized protein n=3 Tax=Zymoseptoria tritici TaxID=1047171 RepID=A0A1X7RP69_ZYMT9|nr:unnamed protein product [Zymoseptoria tritici ST99CH_3D7]SMR48596.1 unnamed protein product [Zymoseptoria tritici ST99CH_1E4]SMR49778.1 unnamed protein product [Zymoseptoria tritici ST99CH_3D1]SMY22478.1 unnamed protein product [Zymoseptoria tritici ST99CH_1A5]